MALYDFKRRWPENTLGKYYVGNQCTDCDLCRNTAPTVFGRNIELGYSYVMKQPETKEEDDLCKIVVEHCCMSTVHADGLDYDWKAIPGTPDLPL